MDYTNIDCPNCYDDYDQQPTPPTPVPYVFVYGSIFNVLIIIMLAADFAYHCYSKYRGNVEVHRQSSLRKTTSNVPTTIKYSYSQERMKQAIADRRLQERKGTAAPPSESISVKVSSQESPAMPRVSPLQLLTPKQVQNFRASMARKDREKKLEAERVKLERKSQPKDRPITEEDWFPEFRRKNFIRAKYAPIVLSKAKVEQMKQREDELRSKLQKRNRRRSKGQSSSTAVNENKGNVFATLASVMRLSTNANNDSEKTPTIPTSSETSRPSALLQRRLGDTLLPPSTLPVSSPPSFTITPVTPISPKSPLATSPQHHYSRNPSARKSQNEKRGKSKSSTTLMGNYK